MTDRIPTFYSHRYNNYVPAATFANDVVYKGTPEVDFGAPVAANPTAILNGQSIATASDNITLGVPLLQTEIAAPFGRNLQVVADGAATSAVTIDGFDYLGQPMRETLTLNGTTPVLGGKAFKWIARVSWGATAGRTINVGTGARLGLPWRTTNVLAETVNSAAGTVGTLTAPVLTDPQTATTSDPRGLYQPNATMNGSNRIQITVLTDAFINAAGNGGLYGIRHFTAA